MSVNTWEEFCRYVWQHNSGDTTLYAEVEGDFLYYYLDEEEPVRRFWLRINESRVGLLTDTWHIVGESPLATNILTPQEKVCKKIALMEARWKNYQLRKQHAI